MTAPRSPDHLDDEDLSALLDGVTTGADAGDHVAVCTSCAGRVASLRSARDALAAAAVAPLPTSLLDELVGAALAERATAADASSGGEGEVAPLRPPRRTRGRRLSTPPPAWLVGAAAALAVVVGFAGLLRAGGGSDELASEGSAAESAAAAKLPADAEGTAADASAAFDADPEAVVADLGDVADPTALAAALESTTRTAPGAATVTAGAERATEEQEAAGTAGGAAGGSRAAPPAPSVAPAAGGSALSSAAPAGPPDRARCRADAERIGAGRLGPLLTTATLRWAGQPAEVLVFSLVEPAGGFTRQALVLARPGCALLADPRW